MNDVAQCEVTVLIAVSENGDVESSVYDRFNVQKRLMNETWLKSKREDTKLWTIKTITTFVALPVQYEDLK